MLVPESGTFLAGPTKSIPLNWKLRLLPGHFGPLISLNQQATKGITVLRVVIDLEYHVKLDCFSTTEVKEIISGVQGIL